MRLSAAAIAALGLAFTGSPKADPVSDFYRDRQVSLILSAGEGGGYSTYARVFAPFLASQIPGKPNIVVQNMPGAGGIRAMMYFQSGAPRDGSSIGLVHSGVPLAPLFKLNGANFDSLSMHWLGALTRADAICVAWHTSNVKTWDDLFTKEFIVGGTGAGSQMETYPALLNALFGTKIKIVSGYKGGNEVYMAMERGEVQGRCGGGFASLEATRPQWLKQSLITVPVLFALERSSERPGDVPLIERAKDLRTKQILQLALMPQAMDRPFLAPAGVPEDRAKALRAAFAAAANDKQFREQAAKQRLEIEPVTGEEVERMLKSAFQLPPEVVKAAAVAMRIE
ncbi:MAG: Bug family tripartite tricarboxylate transporter substrate binding protein [Beijerinckiaceae bacterium]